MRAPVKFTRPPVYEVACGVYFSGQKPLLTAHVGAYWQRIRKEFPNVEDAAPLQGVVEQPGVGPVIDFQISHLPQLRRAWFLSPNGSNLIQLQQDRFLFNWKRASDTDSYPSYAVVIEQFEQHLADFLTFCREVGVGELTFRQFELAYVNGISRANGLDVTGTSGLLVDHMRAVRSDRFLPEPENFIWTTGYQLPEGRGRLHVTAQTALNAVTQEPLVRLDMIARGITPDSSEAGRRSWFDLAHAWITHGFADVTSPSLHAESHWQRTS